MTMTATEIPEIEMTEKALKGLIAMAVMINAVDGHKMSGSSVDEIVLSVRQQKLMPLEFAVTRLKRIASSDEVPAENQLDALDALIAIEAYRISQPDDQPEDQHVA